MIYLKIEPSGVVCPHHSPELGVRAAGVQTVVSGVPANDVAGLIFRPDPWQNISDEIPEVTMPRCENTAHGISTSAVGHSAQFMAVETRMNPVGATPDNATPDSRP
jgi:hypothetical protein